MKDFYGKKFRKSQKKPNHLYTLNSYSLSFVYSVYFEGLLYLLNVFPYFEPPESHLWRFRQFLAIFDPISDGDLMGSKIAKNCRKTPKMYITGTGIWIHI